MASEARPAGMPQSHDLLVSNVKVAKAAVQARLEGGDRDWPALRAAVEKYIDFQTAADVLSGQTAMLR